MKKNHYRIAFLILIAATASAWCQQEPQPDPADKPAADETVVKMGNAELKGWQIDVMLENRAGNDLISAADFWVDIQLKAQEARRRGLDKTPEGQFILQLYQDYFLGNLLTKVLTEDAPKATDEQAKAEYDANPDKYKQQFMANVEHLTLQQRDQAKAAMEDLQKADADFNAIYQKYYQGPEDRMRGRLFNTPWDRLKVALGDQAAEAVKNAKPNEVLGPFLGMKGFEIIRVKSVRLERMPAFDEIKDQIIQQLNRQAQADYPQKVINDLKEKSPVKESDRLTKQREEQMKKQQEAAEKARQSENAVSSPGK